MLDLKEAFEKLPRAARTAIRRHVHIYVSESFFISAEASKLYFNVTKEIEQHGCFYVYKKWKQKSRPMGEFYRLRVTNERVSAIYSSKKGKSICAILSFLANHGIEFRKLCV